LCGDGPGPYVHMSAVCDVHEPSRQTIPARRACARPIRCGMAKWARVGQFNERVFAGFVECLGIYPVNTLVGLQSGRLSVFAEPPCGKSLLLAWIKVFYSPRGTGLNGKRK
jgi:hypothetical protein